MTQEDYATKRDLNALEGRLNKRMDKLDQVLDGLKAKA